MYKLLILLAFMSMYMTSEDAYGKDIARWTDAEGNVHFGNSQFAPAGKAEPIAVQAANGMDVPKAPPTANRGGSRSVAHVKKAPKKNKRGWTGYRKKHGRR
jgi:hypothetical protein